ncbi:hypothetical protein LDENG_00222560 [Lucifuga dentata]|nr:hypothetical protein LDENG_00222560 [Lucifuga dentata]
MDFSRTVLVTGGSGFIGSHLVCSLVNRHPDWRIINLDNLDYCSSLRSLETVEDRANYTFIRGDVCNPHLVSHVFSSENIDVVFHLAAKTHVEASFVTPCSFRRVNKTFLVVSPLQVFDESSPLRPSNPYSATKAAAEHLVRSYWDKYKFPVIITRSNNIYGPRQHTEKVIPRFLTLLQKNKKCTIQGTLPKSRHFLFVDDAVKAFLTVMEKGIVGEIYNVGTSCEIPIMQLAKELVAMVKSVPDSELNDWLEFVPDRPRVDLRYPISCEKLQWLGWRPEVSWAEGIRHTVKWYQDNPDFWSDASDERGPIRSKLGVVHSHSG